jgi:hypothetical protein
MTETQDLIIKMRLLQVDMMIVARALKSKGIAAHAAELDGAANMLGTWIDGIDAEEKGDDHGR